MTVPWSEEDIDLLYDMYMRSMSLSKMSRILRRSEDAVRKAIRNIKLQHCLHFSLDHVADVHGCNESDLYQLVPYKYNVQIDECEDVTASESEAQSVEEGNSTASWILMVFIAFFCMKIYTLVSVYPMHTIPS